jgi:hypothetical protein
VATRRTRGPRLVPVEVKIGVQHSPRELVIESSLSTEEVETLVSKALADGGVLSLIDDNGRKLIIPVERISYIEIARPEARRVGFGNNPS